MATGHRAGTIVVRDGHIALMRRRRAGRGYWAVPGGSVERGETVEEAAVREAAEELGIEVRLVRKVAEVRGAARGPGVQHYFLAETDADVLELGGPEAERSSADNLYEPRWVQLTDVERLNLLPRSLRDVIAVAAGTGQWPATPVVVHERRSPR